MKKSIIIAALMCGTAHAEFKDGNKLYSQMNGTVNETLNAIGYVTGVSDALFGSTHCAPSTVTAGQIYDMTKQYLESSPSTRHNSADVIVGYVLVKQWPCPKRGSGT